MGPLPYGDGLYSMSVFLPKPGKSVDELIAMLDDQSWSTWLAAFQTQELELSLPRFELEYEKTLNDVLVALGMQDAFDPSAADFFGIEADHDLWISEVKHKTYVDVDEEGTEAAAVTGIGVRVTSVPPRIVVNRPFVFAIRERATGTILFLGVMMDPTA